jgi:hypothetical protein
LEEEALEEEEDVVVVVEELFVSNEGYFGCFARALSNGFDYSVRNSRTKQSTLGLN